MGDFDLFSDHLFLRTPLEGCFWNNGAITQRIPAYLDYHLKLIGLTFKNILENTMYLNLE